MHRVHPVSCQLARHAKERPLKLHQRRDLCALSELEFALLERGFRHGEPIFNQSPPDWPADRSFEMDLPPLAHGDRLLQCMRLPINDLEEGPKRKIALANTTLEKIFFAASKPYIDWSSRTHMRISPGLQALIRPGFEDRREMSFRQKGWGAPYYELNALDGRGWRKHKGPRRTALFLIHVESLWKDGPGYLCAFGMDGCTTVVWAYRLARDFQHLLDKPGFVLAELELGEIPAHATDLRFCMDWKIEPLLVYEHAAGEPLPVKPAPILAPREAARSTRRPVLVPQG